MSLILIVEDDLIIREEISDALRFHGYDVATSGEGKPGLEMALRMNIDLAVLDLMLPDLDGLTICRKIKDVKPRVPVILLTVRGQENDKLLGFEMGADDYLTKPFSLKELLARIHAVLKRSVSTAAGAAAMSDVATIGRVQVDFSKFIVLRDGTELLMTAKECAILKILVQAPGKVIGREQIIETVWKREYEPTTRTVDNFILKLRQKIEETPEDPRHILTIHGVGYKLVL